MLGLNIVKVGQVASVIFYSHNFLEYELSLNNYKNSNFIISLKFLKSESEKWIIL